MSLSERGVIPGNRTIVDKILRRPPEKVSVLLPDSVRTVLAASERLKPHIPTPIKIMDLMRPFGGPSGNEIRKKREGTLTSKYQTNIEAGLGEDQAFANALADVLPDIVFTGIDDQEKRDDLATIVRSAGNFQRTSSLRDKNEIFGTIDKVTVKLAKHWTMGRTITGYSGEITTEQGQKVLLDKDQSGILYGYLDPIIAVIDWYKLPVMQASTSNR